jgi:hypothetical protein
MLKQEAADRRALHEERIEADLVVVGGGLAGVCCAITAARAGLRVALVQDRPVLGGNASSEVRLWILGATSHLGNNNRWAREGGVVDEILVENLYRNPEGNPVLLDALLLEWAAREPRLRLLLNTAVFAVDKTDAEPDRIAAVHAYCSQNETRYTLAAPLFCDASGDGVVGYLAGAAFRMGAERPEEFGERFAPPGDYQGKLGHSIFFYSRDTGRPVEFVPPAFALRDITRIPRHRSLKLSDSGCRLWWLEYGGALDTVHDTEAIKWELWRIAYGVWNHIKNSGEFPEAQNLTLDWVGVIPGKRESRRFEGDAMLIQQDIVEQRQPPDAVSYGGWAIDVHPTAGVYSERDGCMQWHARGVYPLPYRCLYSRNVANLFLAGRIISASHVAFASARVMATCAHGGQAVGLAAAFCARADCLPRALTEPARMRALQTALQRSGQFIPHVAFEDPEDLAPAAEITASSEYALSGFAANDGWLGLDDAVALLVPADAGPLPPVTFRCRAAEPTAVEARLYASSRRGNYTPDVTLASRTVRLRGGDPEAVVVAFDVALAEPGYVFIALLPTPGVDVALSDERVTGALTVSHSFHDSVARASTQRPPPEYGVDTFEFWLPGRRPTSRNLAFSASRPLHVFRAGDAAGGQARPFITPNAWVARADDPRPRLSLRWPEPVRVRSMILFFDADHDHPMESVLMGHPERVMPFCVRHYRIVTSDGRVLHEVTDNHQARNEITLAEAVDTDALHLEIHTTHGAPAALFRWCVYSDVEAEWKDSRGEQAEVRSQESA